MLAEREDDSYQLYTLTHTQTHKHTDREHLAIVALSPQGTGNAVTAGLKYTALDVTSCRAPYSVLHTHTHTQKTEHRA